MAGVKLAVKSTIATALGALLFTAATLPAIAQTPAPAPAQRMNGNQFPPGVGMAAPVTPEEIEAAKPNPQAPGFRIPLPPLDQMDPAMRATRIHKRFARLSHADWKPCALVSLRSLGCDGHTGQMICLSRWARASFKGPFGRLTILRWLDASQSQWRMYRVVDAKRPDKRGDEPGVPLPNAVLKRWPRGQDAKSSPKKRPCHAATYQSSVMAELRGHSREGHRRDL